jgi:hemerythrin-like domain-containing protein
MDLNNEISGETIAAALTRDHECIGEIADELHAALEDGERERAESRYAELRERLLRHIGFEEQRLFPVFEARTMLSAPCAVMRREHRRIETVLDAIGGALEVGRTAEARATLAELVAHLSAHDYKEELVLYPNADPVLSAEERSFLVEEMRKR